jgi:hypothetical protein
MAKTWEAQHPATEALRLYECAHEALGNEPPNHDDVQWRDEWVQIQSDRVFAHYWPGRVPEMELLVADMTSRLESAATPWQRVRLDRAQLQLSLRKQRYLLNREAVELARSVLNGCLTTGDLVELPLAHFVFAFTLLLNQDLLAAEWELKSALALADRTGDTVSQARCLTYLSVCLRRGGRVEEAKGYVERARSVAEALGMSEYIGTSLANQAWLTLESADWESIEALTQAALTEWRKLPFVYSFQWTALLPRLCACLARGNLIEACACARAVLDEFQQRLPGDVEQSLWAGVQALEQTTEAGRTRFQEAIVAARRHSLI